MPLASDCIAQFGSYPIQTDPIQITEPACGWDTAEVTWFLSEADGDVDAQLELNGFSRNSQYELDLHALARMYVLDIVNKARVPGGWAVTLGIQGLNSGVGASGLAKFYRQPYRAALEFKTSGGDGVTFTLSDDDGDPITVITDSAIRFTKPGVSFQDCYIADGTAFDPDEEMASGLGGMNNLRAVGFGTNDTSDPKPGSVLSDWWVDDKTETPAMQAFNHKWPVTNVINFVGSAPLLQFNFNHGFILMQRQAERVIPDASVDLWLITDTFTHFQKVDLT